VGRGVLSDKPTGDEALRRISYVVARAFAGTLGGAILSREISNNIRIPYNQIPGMGYSDSPSGNFSPIIFVSSIVAMFVVLRVMKNIIRKMQARAPRPLLDIDEMKRNLRRRNNRN